MKIFSLITIILVSIIGNLFGDENYVTVYNDNLGLIKQIRTVNINKNDLTLRFTDVAAQLIPTSVHLRSLSGNKDFRVLEQNFEYDLISSDKIMQKYIDHPIEIIKESGEIIKGNLLSKQGSSMVLKTEDGIKILAWNDKMSINVKELPEGLITKPTLIWELAGVKGGKEELEVSYLSSGMNWHTEYVGVLNETGSKINLDAWVSIDNKCGAAFKDAHLKLVAGEVHRAPSRRMRGYMVEELEVAVAGKGIGEFVEREFFEYHIYDLDRITTLNNNQIKQIALFPSTEVNSIKKFYYNGQRDPEKVEVKVLFKNEKNAGLGMPLPAGIFRIYQKDKQSLEFAGEDRIDHTPLNEEVKITVGKSFDLIGERKVVDSKKISKTSEKQTIEIELRNNKKKEDVVIIVEESMNYRNWEIEDNNYPFIKKTTNLIEFNIPVKANNKSVLRYTVQYSW